MNPLLLEVFRNPSGVSSTIGRLFISGAYYCDTIEDLVREVPGVPVERWKKAGTTAIPAGEYEVLLTVSERAERGHLWTPQPDHVLPLLVDVPGFSGIRIHAGNTAANVEGCIAVGRWDGVEALEQSRSALTELMSRLRAADDAGCQIRMQIWNPR